MRILLASKSSPIPPNSGDRQRTYTLWRALRQLGQVDLFLIQPAGTVSESLQAELREYFGLVGMGYLTPRGRRGAWRVVRSLHPPLVDRLAHNFGRRTVQYSPDPAIVPQIKALIERNHYDLIVGRYLVAAAQAGVIGRHPLIVDMDDMDTQLYASQLQTPGLSSWKRLVLLNHLRQLKRIVPRLAGQCDHVWLSCPDDLRLLKQSQVSALPNIPFVPADQDMPPSCQAAPQSKVVLIVGSMRHRVNVEAIDRFVSKVWPTVKQAVPDAVFRIVGSNMSEAQRQHWAQVSGVDALGTVDDMRGAYVDCAFTVVPLYEGGGTKLKVVESYMYGRMCLTTHAGLRGYDHLLKHGQVTWVVADDAELAAGCIKLLNDPELRDRLAQTGTALVREYFTFHRFLDIVTRDIQAVLSQVPTTRV